MNGPIFRADFIASSDPSMTNNSRRRFTRSKFSMVRSIYTSNLQAEKVENKLQNFK